MYFNNIPPFFVTSARGPLLGPGPFKFTAATDTSYSEPGFKSESVALVSVTSAYVWALLLFLDSFFV